MLRTTITRIRAHYAARRRALPVICDQCRTDWVRYLYTDDHGQLAETRCTSCAMPWHDPAVDLGQPCRLTVGQAEDHVTPAPAPVWPQVATPDGLTAGHLRQLTAGLPDTTRIRVEDASRAGAVPGSAAIHPVTGAAIVPDTWDTDGVLLLIDPSQED